jgi:hypothetical protein
MVFEITNTQNDYIFIFNVICVLFFPLNFRNCIGDVVVSMYASSEVDGGFKSIPGQVNPKTIKLVFDASLLSTQH